ncbi:hypothetical protein BG261_02425 [Floricoccus tropicus]|uniref:N-acetyltransferase domain-containing protein n=1 Tax=Floricoccus tropicus TaxID=1859473 RepID=A0A1E8GMI8_9LACT|nr:GNAT family N-acetyltransferase [Floricoccus tropicus]OFI49452.1 hypothetical protein BG261_02425 [Floricoccus tropicus]
MVRYRVAAMEDTERLADLTSRAFEFCPLFYNGLKASFNSHDDYYIYIKKLFKVLVTSYVRNSCGVVGTINDKIVSMALIIEPESKDIGIFDYLKSGGKSLLPSFISRPLLSLLISIDDGLKPCETKRNEYTWHLEMLAVDIEMQGEGLGSHMMENCIFPMVIKNGAKNMTLVTNEDKNTTFYKKLGFKEFNRSILKQKYGETGNWSFIKNFE